MVRLIAATLIGWSAVAASGARAETPFYGYSEYFGGVGVYYTRDTDVHQATTMKDADLGFGVRTYTAGGPFWTYRSEATVHRAVYAPRRAHRRRHVVRVKG